MLNRMLIGTLSTLNTFMAPLAGTTDPTNATYKLVETVPSRSCASQSNSFLGLKIDSSLENFITIQVDGRLCAQASRDGRATRSEDIDFRLILPADLLDEEFLQHLPTDSAYVISALPALKQGGPQTRVKITKREPVGETIPLIIEWLPEADGSIPHKPMTLWLKRSLAGNRGLPWEKIEFSELPRDVAQPLAVSGELLSTKLR